MGSRIREKSKTRKKVLIGLAVVLAVAMVVLGLLWNRHLNKSNLLGSFKTPQGQGLYLLGAFHQDHFNRWFNYSMEDLLSAVGNVQPDVVLIEAREAYFEDYGVVDGPIDMAVVYSYCVEQGIPVGMIDWWVVDNDFQASTTNDKRDDMIFANIAHKLEGMGAEARVLVVCGAGHFYEQSERFLEHGFERQRLENRAEYFVGEGETFQYPAGLEEVWEKRAYFYAYTFPDVIAQDEALNDEVKSKFTEGNHDAFYKQQLEYCEWFSGNRLYE